MDKHLQYMQHLYGLFLLNQVFSCMLFLYVHTNPAVWSDMIQPTTAVWELTMLIKIWIHQYIATFIQLKKPVYMQTSVHNSYPNLPLPWEIPTLRAVQSMSCVESACARFSHCAWLLKSFQLITILRTHQPPNPETIFQHSLRQRIWVKSLFTNRTGQAFNHKDETQQERFSRVDPAFG